MTSSKPWFQYYHLFNLMVIVVGIVCSKFLMSLGLMLGGLGFLLERNWRNYALHLQSNPFFWTLLGFYALHFLGLFWSENLVYGWNDIRVKFSLFGIGLIVMSRSLSLKEIRLILGVFVLSVVVISLINFVLYTAFFTHFDYRDIREMSRFGSHIRFGMMVALAPFLGWFAIGNQGRKKWVLCFILLGWCVFYTLYSQVLSGILSLLTALLTVAIYYLYTTKKYVLIFGTTMIPLLLLAGLWWYLSKPINYQIPVEVPVEIMRTEWQKVSSFHYDGLDKKGQQISSTLHRYLSSLGYPIDASGIRQLNKKEIQNIESGYADYREVGAGLMPRLFGLRYQLHETQNPNGHSLLERLEFWSTAWKIIREQPVFGVGTGDVRISFEAMYERNHSLLREDNRWRAHNTYLTTWVTFGAVGLLLFLAFLGYYTIFQWRNEQWIGLVFMGIFLVTFFVEDTLETQTGVTFFAFFYAIFSKKITSL
jgi:hypothetical protein